jgi:molybdopterin-guanine dinucleotide biosynthesis protein A
MKPMKSPFSIAIEAGGKSSRMGQDKGLLIFLGNPLFQHIIDQVADLSDDIFVISNQPERYATTSVPVYGDSIEGIGALGGLFSALRHAQHERCLVLACDMPIVNRDLILHLVRAAPGADAVVPQLDERKLEPFRAVYARSCLPAIESAIQRGERRAVSFLPYVDTLYVAREELEALNPSLDTFLNINTPEDLARVEAYARQLEQR